MRRSIVGTWLLLGGLLAGEVGAAPRRLAPAERAEITSLARRVMELVRDGARDPSGIFPTPAELRVVFGLRDPGDAGPDGGGMVVRRQLEALERDARDLRPRLAGAQFRGIAGPSYARNTIDPRRCGRYAAPGSQCVDGPVVEYAVGGSVRRFRIDTLVRVGGRWRVLDLRP
ncbi:MAG: hypothetical protein IPF99_13960 [Deltaproteobacteria bacterium]|nr:hypothetical protein [Deltaproteobacteria bacterium]